MELSQGTILNNRYRIERLLGKGGMGAVHLAEDLTLDHEVAVKSNMVQSESGKSQFLREAHLLASLRHSHLPRVIDYFIMEGVQYLVMDYIPGEDLENMRRNSGIQPVNQVMAWARQLGDALSYLHIQNPPIIHRDIKPANLKLTQDGEVVLVDFGIAKAGQATSATSTGATGYTPGYAPPEQYGSGHTGPYSDQYSFGATLYALLSGQRPVESVLLAMGEAVLAPIHIYNPQVPPFVENAIQKAMAPRPQDRFANISDFVRALNDPNWQNAFEGSDATVASGTPITASQPRKRSNAWIWGCGGVLLLGLIIGAVVLASTLIPMLNKTSTGVAQTGVTQESATQNLVLPIHDTETPEPSPTPGPIATEEATLTDTPTQEPTPSATPMLLGGEGNIAFVSDREDGSTLQIWAMKVYQTMDNQIIAGDLNQITFGVGNKTEPDWSQDGEKIVYSAPDTDGTGSQIYIINVADGDSSPFKVTDIDGENTSPSWSPDGKQILFTNYGRFNDIYQIYVIGTDGQNRRRLSEDYQEYFPIWSPDGKTILYIAMIETHQYLFYRSITDEFKETYQYDPTTFFGRLGEVKTVDWSPDGQYLAYTRMDGQELQVYSSLYATKGADIADLTPDDALASEPSWSPDSQWVVFTSQRGSNSEIYIMTNTGLLQTNLTLDSGTDMQPDWH